LRLPSVFLPDPWFVRPSPLAHRLLDALLFAAYTVARSLALEHLMMERGRCTFNSLKQAREFMKIQKSS
jgi:hypothetical protein